MGNLVFNGATSGSTTVQPTDAVSPTLTLPSVTGTLAINGPAFLAYLTGNQSVSNNTWTKVTLNTEGFDTNNCFDSTTNYRFTPTIAGYYQFNAAIMFSISSGTAPIAVIAISKNGSRVAQNESVTTINNGHSLVISSLLYLNGTTDYIELQGYISSTSGAFTSGADITYLSGFLARTA